VTNTQACTTNYDSKSFYSRASSHPRDKSVWIRAGGQVYRHDIGRVSVETLKKLSGLDVPECASCIAGTGQDLQSVAQKRFLFFRFCLNVVSSGKVRWTFVPCNLVLFRLRSWSVTGENACGSDHVCIYLGYPAQGDKVSHCRWCFHQYKYRLNLMGKQI